MSYQYAANTSVTVEQSQGRCQALLARAGAMEVGIINRAKPRGATLGFKIADPAVPEGVPVRMEVQAPEPTDPKVRFTAKGSERKDAALAEAIEQEYRRRWRVTELLIKAKLEAIEGGGSSVLREFLYNVALPKGRLLGPELVTGIENIVKSGNVPLLGSGK